MNDSVKAYLSELGKKGGSSKSAKKRASSRANAAKATAARRKIFERRQAQATRPIEITRKPDIYQ